jgi:RNA polymerase sigma-70 factor (ECF subfamily)
MVAVLSRVFGLADLQLVEDIVSESMYKALAEWPFHGVPDNPSAWLYRVAKNQVIDKLRKEKRQKELNVNVSRQALLEYNLTQKIDELFLDTEIEDSQLRMMFACCHPDIPLESQIALTLKTLCGFGAKEIAKAFLSTEETINKRLVRARQKLREEQVSLEVPAGNALKERLEAVYKTIYLLFNEGYNSSVSNELIHKDVCFEAMRLCVLLMNNSVTDLPETKALLALMCFHAARLDTRVDSDGCLVLLKDQDRSRWDAELLRKGYGLLNEASKSEGASVYHIEAAILATHCQAARYEDTNWRLISQLYDALYMINASPVALLNKAVVTAQIEGPEKALESIKGLEMLDNYYLYYAVLGELYMQSGDHKKAAEYLKKARSLTGSVAEEMLLDKKLKMLESF